LKKRTVGPNNPCMAKLQAIISDAHRYLKVADVEDYPGAHNGLQVENSGSVKRILAAVDVGLPVIKKAAEAGPGSLLVVHHGLFWSGVQMVTGIFREKLELMLEADMALYSVHLPLDAHAAIGNNVLLAKALGLRGLRPFLGFGRAGTFTGFRTELVRRLMKTTGRVPEVCAAGPARPRKVGVITGGAGDMVEKAAAGRWPRIWPRNSGCRGSSSTIRCRCDPAGVFHAVTSRVRAGAGGMRVGLGIVQRNRRRMRSLCGGG